jgi:hypothetical protein
MVRAGIDSAGAGIEGGEPGHANSSLPTAYCLLSGDTKTDRSGGFPSTGRQKCLKLGMEKV